MFFYSRQETLLPRMSIDTNIGAALNYYVSTCTSYWL